MLLGAAATIGPDVLVEVLLAVVIDELLPRLNVLDGVDEDMSTLYLRFAIGFAGMIDIPRDIRTHRAVYRLPTVHLEEVLTAA